jgi:Flp pilus assembly protein TadB
MALPILLALFELTFRRAYMRPLYTTKVGVGMLIFAVTILSAGGAWMRKVVKVEV